MREQQEKLNASFTPMEIHQAIKQQKKGKSPGPDAIIMEYYEGLEEEIIPIYKE